MAELQLLKQIRDELKRTVRLLLMQLQRDHPTDCLYALLLEVDVSETYAIRIAGSEESLTRLAEKYIARGYKVQSGDLLESLRELLRWDATGDDKVGWYWGDQEEDVPLTRLIEQAVEAGLIQGYDESHPLRRLCHEALRELDDEGAFGSGQDRERVLIGVSCCEVGFGDKEDIEELAALNPARTISRLRQELRSAAEVDRLLIRPKK